MISHSFEWDSLFDSSRKKLSVNPKKEGISDLEIWNAWKSSLEYLDGLQTLLVGGAHRDLRILKIFTPKLDPQWASQWRAH